MDFLVYGSSAKISTMYLYCFSINHRLTFSERLISKHLSFYVEKHEIKQNTTALMDSVNVQVTWLLSVLSLYCKYSYAEKAFATVHLQVVAKIIIHTVCFH